MPEKTINQYREGMLTEKEAIDILDKIQVQGAFREKASDKWFFIGYDYKNQAWITIE